MYNIIEGKVKVETNLICSFSEIKNTYKELILLRPIIVVKPVAYASNMYIARLGVLLDSSEGYPTNIAMIGTEEDISADIRANTTCNFPVTQNGTFSTWYDSSN